MTRIDLQASLPPVIPHPIVSGVLLGAGSDGPGSAVGYTQGPLLIAPTVPGIATLWKKMSLTAWGSAVGLAAGAAAALSCFPGDIHIRTGIIEEGLAALGVLLGICGAGYRYGIVPLVMRRLVHQAFVVGDYEAQSKFLYIVKKNPERLAGVSLEPLADYWKKNLEKPFNLRTAAQSVSALLEVRHEGARSQAQRIVGEWTKEDMQAACGTAFLEDDGKFLDQLEALNLKVTVRDMILDRLCDGILAKCDRSLAKYGTSHSPALKDFIQDQVRAMPLGSAGQVYRKLRELNDQCIFVSIKTDEVSGLIDLVLGDSEAVTDWVTVYSLLERKRAVPSGGLTAGSYRGTGVSEDRMSFSLADARDNYLRHSESGYEKLLRTIAPQYLGAELDALLDVLTSETVVPPEKAFRAYLIVLNRIDTAHDYNRMIDFFAARLRNNPEQEDLMACYVATVLKGGEAGSRIAALGLLADCCDVLLRRGPGKVINIYFHTIELLERSYVEEVAQRWLDVLIRIKQYEKVLVLAEVSDLSFAEKCQRALEGIPRESKDSMDEPCERIAMRIRVRRLEEELKSTPAKFRDLSDFGERPKGWITAYLVHPKGKIDGVVQYGISGKKSLSDEVIATMQDYAEASPSYDRMVYATLLLQKRPETVEADNVVLEVLLDPESLHVADQEDTDKIKTNFRKAREYSVLNTHCDPIHDNPYSFDVRMGIEHFYEKMKTLNEYRRALGKNEKMEIKKPVYVMLRPIHPNHVRIAV